VLRVTEIDALLPFALLASGHSRPAPESRSQRVPGRRC
jgi:hypothetical protein